MKTYKIRIANVSYLLSFESLDAAGEKALAMLEEGRDKRFSCETVAEVTASTGESKLVWLPSAHPIPPVPKPEPRGLVAIPEGSGCLYRDTRPPVVRDWKVGTDGFLYAAA